MKFSKIILEEDDSYEQSERRINKEWELGPNCPKIGLRAHALFKYLLDIGDISEDDDIDVYNCVPDGTHFYMTRFKVVDSDVEDNDYIVGDYDDVENSCYEELEEFINEHGYDGFRKGFVESFIDADYIVNYSEDLYTDWVNDSPGDYIEDEYRLLSKKQESRINFLEKKIKFNEENIEKLQSYYDGDNDEVIDDKIDEINDKIREYEDEIEEIKSDPDGDFPDSMIEQVIREYVNEVRRDPLYFLKSYDFELNRFINKDDLIHGIIEEDGYGTVLNHYDGTVDEEIIRNNTYYIMRID